MEKKLFLATNNHGKIERYSKLIAKTGSEFSIFTPKDFGLDVIDPKETGKTIDENAEIKARAYFGKVDIPILSNDTGFWVDGEGLVEAPKRIALGNDSEETLSKEEMAERLMEFWKQIAEKYRGKVDAAWVETFVLLMPDGTMHLAHSRREVILTNQLFGTPHIQMPVRALYISKVTNKPSVQHSEEEEWLEMQPIVNALKELLERL